MNNKIFRDWNLRLVSKR